MSWSKALTPLSAALLFTLSPASLLAQSSDEEEVDEGPITDETREGVSHPDRRDPLLSRVNELDQRAQEAFARGDYEGALNSQRAAQALIPASPRLFNMAACEERLEHHERAIELYEQFVASPDAPQSRRDQARERVSQLRELIVEERLEQERAEAAANAAPREGADESDGLAPGAFWAMVGLTSATAVGSIVLGALTLARHEEFLSLYQNEGNSAELRETGQSLSLATNILLGFTALAALTTLVFGLDTNWRRWRQRREGRVSMSPSFGPGGGALSVAGRF